MTLHLSDAVKRRMDPEGKRDTAHWKGLEDEGGVGGWFEEALNKRADAQGRSFIMVTGAEVPVQLGHHDTFMCVDLLPATHDAAAREAVGL